VLDPAGVAFAGDEVAGLQGLAISMPVAGLVATRVDAVPPRQHASSRPGTAQLGDQQAQVVEAAAVC
jgi:hypothetical protein